MKSAAKIQQEQNIAIRRFIVELSKHSKDSGLRGDAGGELNHKRRSCDWENDSMAQFSTVSNTRKRPRVHDFDETIIRRDEKKKSEDICPPVAIRTLQRRIFPNHLQIYLDQGSTLHEMSEDLSKTEKRRRFIKSVDALLENPDLDLRLYLHKLLPSVITCVVAKNLATLPCDDHWSLREEAAQCLKKICLLYGDKSLTLKPRVLRVFTEALRKDRPPTTQYGGIVGLSVFGPLVIDEFLLPLACDYWKYWERELESSVNSQQANVAILRQHELHQCQQALLSALGILMNSMTVDELAKRVDYTSFVGVFGERMIPMMSDDFDCMVSI